MSEDPRIKGETWVCGVCGETHSDLPHDFGWQLPDELWILPEKERQEKLEWSTDLAYHDGRWFVRGVLFVPINDGGRRWGWGIWAEIDETAMNIAYYNFTEDASDAPLQPGTIANKIPGFEDSVGQQIIIRFGTADVRPLFFFPEDSQHPLAVEQREGISIERYHEILESTY